MPAKAKVILQKFVENKDNKNCYVLFKTQEAAKLSLQQNGQEYNGRVLRVDLAFEQHNNFDYCIFIGNLGYQVEEQQLRTLFKDKDIEYIRIIRDKDSHAGKGIAYVSFKKKEDYRQAVLMNGVEFKGRKLRVKKAVEKKRLEKKDRQRKMVAELKQQQKQKGQVSKQAFIKKDTNIFNQSTSNNKSTSIHNKHKHNTNHSNTPTVKKKINKAGPKAIIKKQLKKEKNQK